MNMDIDILIDLAYKIDLFKLRQTYGIEQTDNIGTLYNQWHKIKITLLPLTADQMREIQRQVPYGYIEQELNTLAIHRRDQEQTFRVARMFAERDK